MTPLPVVHDRAMSFKVLNKHLAAMQGPGKCLQWVKMKNDNASLVKAVFQRSQGARTTGRVLHERIDRHTIDRHTYVM